MLGERSDQRGLWEADRLYLDHVGKDTFYGLLASLRGRLFRDADFAGFYCADNGRDSVPPSLLATAGAVKDSYNLLADGIVKLLWALAAVERHLSHLHRPTNVDSTLALVRESALFLGGDGLIALEEAQRDAAHSQLPSPYHKELFRRRLSDTLSVCKRRS